jgi:hypothetical protein
VALVARLFPVLHFRLRYGSDAFTTPAIFYPGAGLQPFAQRLGLPIDLERPIGRKAA